MKEMTDRQLIRILLIAVLLLVLGEAYLIFAVSGRSAGAQSVSSIIDTAQVPASPASSAVVPLTLQPILGTVSVVGSGSFTVSQSDSSMLTTVDVSSGTSIFEQGPLLNQATQDVDMAKFHAYTQELMEDPGENQDALAHLIAPSQYQTTVLQLSDLKAGDTVSILGGPQSDRTFAAAQVIVTPATSTQ